VEEIAQREDEGDGSNWCKTSVFALILSQNVSFGDKALLSRRMGRALALTWFARLISDRAKPILD